MLSQKVPFRKVLRKVISRLFKVTDKTGMYSVKFPVKIIGTISKVTNERY